LVGFRSVLDQKGGLLVGISSLYAHYPLPGIYALPALFVGR